jgi:hypothetical protein
VNEIKSFGGLASTINNAPNIFTVDFGHFSGQQQTSINAADTTATTNHLTLVFGDTTGSASIYGALNTTGYGTIDIISTGTGGGAENFISYISPNPPPPNTFSANPGGSEVVNISGTQTFGIWPALILSGNNATINDTDTAYVTIASTNAAVINASLSGGLGISTTNFNGTVGDVITGSATHANSLGGSLGNDVITASNVGGDTVITGGGADTINLNSHTIGDTVKLGGSLIVNAGDLTNAGFWGVPPSGAGGGVVPAASTSADQSVVTHFTPGGSVADILQFALEDWSGSLPYGFGGPPNAVIVFGDGNTSVLPHGPIFGPFPPLSPVLDVVASGATLAATANVFELTGATFDNASALANALGSSYNLTFAGTGVAANNNVHMLFLYDDASGNGHVADVDFENGVTAATTTTAVSHIVASDMVQLTGVSVTSLTVNNIHFVYS